MRRGTGRRGEAVWFVEAEATEEEDEGEVADEAAEGDGRRRWRQRAVEEWRQRAEEEEEEEEEAKAWAHPLADDRRAERRGRRGADRVRLELERGEPFGRQARHGSVGSANPPQRGRSAGADATIWSWCARGRDRRRALCDGGRLAMAAAGGSGAGAAGGHQCFSWLGRSGVASGESPSNLDCLVRTHGRVSDWPWTAAVGGDLLTSCRQRPLRSSSPPLLTGLMLLPPRSLLSLLCLSSSILDVLPSRDWGWPRGGERVRTGMRWWTPEIESIRAGQKLQARCSSSSSVAAGALMFC